jgi:hypothetical protein
MCHPERAPSLGTFLRIHADFSRFSPSAQRPVEAIPHGDD